jgi:hypothetical protein
MKIATREQLRKLRLADYSDDDRTRLATLQDLSSRAPARGKMTLDDLWAAVDTVHYSLDEGLITDSLARDLAAGVSTAFLSGHKENASSR